MKQLNIFDMLAVAPQGHPDGTYFVLKKDAFKRVRNAWLKLDVILGPPKFGYRNLRTGWGLIQPDYVGAHWIDVPKDELPAVLAGHASGEMATVDSYLSADMKTFDWGWRKAKRRSAIDGAVSVGRNPGGGEIRLKKVPGRKAKWIYEVDIYSADGSLFTRRELGLWMGMMFFGDVETAQKGVELTFGEAVAELVKMIRDADSGTDFGKDRSWETTTAETLARKLVYMKRASNGKPLELEEYLRLLELNGLRNRTGRFSEDRSLNLSLDHLYAELVVKYLAFGAENEDVWADGPTEWTQAKNGGWLKGAYVVGQAASTRKGNRGRYGVRPAFGTIAPKVRGVFKDAERAIAAVDTQVFSRSFEERHFDGFKEDFRQIKREIFKAGLRLYEMNHPHGEQNQMAA
ncbi:hypothetical protein [Pelobacter propionicus]|uniref:Uncharacterized protein n=1 Tax=Pelobacter propionicus (strain DSM 2379 / NBRC 103807 / OttBd1) TaxID=338966 RepID=A0R7T8_PELPD|nr:hypothetical protein [Pelobacter propionicus]ABL01403.1 hypothetical protein Ppro_3815 [Pelobacter propionicus DSM 2379]